MNKSTNNNNANTNTQNNNNTKNAGFSWGSTANANANNNNNSSNNNNTFSWGNSNNNNNNNSSSNNANKNNNTFSWGSGNNNNNNNNGANNKNNNTFSWGSGNNNKNNATNNNNNNSSAWNFNSNNNNNSSTNNNNNNSNNNNTWSWGGSGNKNTNNNSNNNNNNANSNNTFSWGNNSSNNNNASNANNNNKSNWNFDFSSSNNNNNSSNNNNNNNNNTSGWNFGSNTNNNNASNNSNNNFGTNGNNNAQNGPLFAKHNQNPYQIDMRAELKELNDPSSALNQSFAGQSEGYWKQSIFSPNPKSTIHGLANSYIQSSKKRMNSSIIKLTPRNASVLENAPRRTPVITIQPRSSMLATSSIHMNANNASVVPPSSSRLNQTTMILSKIVPGANGEPDSKQSTFIDYQAPTPIRPYTSSELRRIPDLGPLPDMPDLSAFDVHKNEPKSTASQPQQPDEPLSDNSGDSPREDMPNIEDKEEEEPIPDEEEIPPIISSTTHRKDGLLYPKLSRDGYYTEPPMDELKTWNAKQLYQCRDFAVYHKAFGCVEWPGVSDIRSLDLDKIVFLSHGRIEVYPDDITDKPQRGQLLNKFAKITLNEIWPEGLEGGTAAEEEDVDHRPFTKEEADGLKKDYGATLMTHCQENDCKFIEYNTTKGNWLFSVEHFTIYGLPKSKPKPKSRPPAPMPPSTPMNITGLHDDVLSQMSHPSMLYSSYNNKVGLNELKNQDIANSFSELINNPYHDEAHTMIIDEEEERGRNYEAMDEPSVYDEEEAEEIDNLHEEVPPDTIIFHENVMSLHPPTEQAPPHKKEAQNVQNAVEYYPNSRILKQPNPATCHRDIAQDFESALQKELDAVLEQSAKNKYRQHKALNNNNNNNDGDDAMSGGFGLHNRNKTLTEFREEERHRKSNWESYDLGFRNKQMFGASLFRNQLYTVMRKEYFVNESVAHFNELKESNAIETHSVMSGMDKILTKPIYFELVNALLTVHKRYYLDDATQWNAMSNGDKLQELADAYGREIKRILNYIHHTQTQHVQNNKMDLGKNILIRFYDALQLIVALYAPRCGSGSQSNLKIKANDDNHDITPMIHDAEEENGDDEDKKMQEAPSINHNKQQQQQSYSELFARRINISHWLQKVIKDEIDNELARIDTEIARLKAGNHVANEEDEKQDIAMDEDCNTMGASGDMDSLNDEKIFVMLSGNRKAEAAEVALQRGDYKLASLISQSSHFAATKNAYQPFVDIRHQIDYWMKHKLWETFNPSKKKIYALLAGRYVEIVFHAKFNWFRCFGIVLWYYLPLHWTLRECLNYYSAMCRDEKFPFRSPYANERMKRSMKQIDKSDKARANEMISQHPVYRAQSAPTFTKKELTQKFPNHVCFDLLQLKAACGDAEEDRIVSIFSSGPRNIVPFNLEYLFQWITYDLLSETKHIVTGTDMNGGRNIYHSFVEQLERMGYWHWAIYLSLFASHRTKERAEFDSLYDYNEIAYMILRRNINRCIPQGLNDVQVTNPRHTAQRLTDITLAQLNNNNNNNNETDDDDVVMRTNNNNRLKHKYCDESESFLRDYLSKFWLQTLDDSTMNGLKFLVHIGVNEAWIKYCLAEYAESNGDWITAFLSYSQCNKWNRVHEILMNHLFMDWLFEDKIDAQLQKTLNILKRNENKISNHWKENGDVLFQYIKIIKSIQNNNSDDEFESVLNEIERVKDAIQKMLNALCSHQHDNDDDDDEEEEDEDHLKKRVCLITMIQRLETCCVHLTK